MRDIILLIAGCLLSIAGFVFGYRSISFYKNKEKEFDNNNNFYFVDRVKMIMIMVTCVAAFIMCVVELISLI